MEFDDAPVQSVYKPQYFSNKEAKIFEAEIFKLLAKNVIEKTHSEPYQITSPIFLVPRPDGAFRMILNLKYFNTYVTYRHFKMDTLNVITNLLSKNCYMASVDLKDAYYSIPIAKQHRKYFKFYFKDQLYQYTCLPNGLSSCPRIFTKLLKPALTEVHKKGHIVAAYLDDLYIQGTTFNECTLALIDTIELFTKLGFIIHPTKSVFVPATELHILGFILNSDTMLVRPTVEKQDAMIVLCNKLLKEEIFSIRSIAQILGKMVSLFPGSLYGPLHYRQVEQDKSVALKRANWNFEVLMTLSNKAQSQLKWWVNNIGLACKPLIHPSPTLVITTDASSSGWGAVCNQSSTGGLWSPVEKKEHINYLEMLTILFGLKTFANNKRDIHIRVMTDNTTAVSVINHMGTSHSLSCNDICTSIWQWCSIRNIWLSVAHIPGKENISADRESRRKYNSSSEWMLNKQMLLSCFEQLSFYPTIDLCASRLNHQCQSLSGKWRY